MFKKLTLSALVALGLTAGGAMAAGDAGHIEDFAFSFEGPFGTFDQEQLRRGLKVYTENCAACHGLKFVPIRTLGDEGGPHFEEEQVIEYAKNFEVFDADLDDFREAKPADFFPESSLSNAPDLSLMTKARSGFHGPYGSGINQMFKGIGGPEYVASILTSYTGETKVQAGTTFYENTAFPGGWIAMPPPLEDESVEFDDGHANDLHHLAEDTTAFLMWTAEPKMMARKRTGFIAVLFLGLLTILLYLTNKKLWSAVKGKKKKH